MDNILKITSGRYSLDWFDTTIHELDLNRIHSLKIDYRGKDSWHVVVNEIIERDNCNEIFSYDLGHWVNVSEVKKLINDPRVKIQGFNNYHNSSDFMHYITKLFLQ